MPAPLPASPARRPVEPFMFTSSVVRNMSLEEAMESLGAWRNEPLSRHTTLRIGGPADWYLEAESVDDISVARIVVRSRSMPFLIIGNGSNLLVADAGFRGLVVKLKSGLASIVELDEMLVKVGAGARLPELARHFKERGIGGLEWGLGIPGSVGGAIFMNAGTRDGEMKDLVENVIVEERGGALAEVKNASCGFGYRTSRFQRTREVIVGAHVRLPEKPWDAALAERTMEHRKKTQPLTQPNCGSVFANPPGDFAARLIEECGLKGKTIGGAQISSLHANFIVNLGAATAQDVKGLMDLAREEVGKRFQIELHSEIRLVGFV